jgi:predicted dehydrogenase
VDDDGFLNRSTSSSDQEKATSPAAYQTSEYHRRVIEDFCEAIWKDRDPAIDGNEGRKALCLIDEIYKTSSSGRVHKNAGSG